MKFRFYSKKEDGQKDAAQPSESVVEPERLLPSGLSDGQKRKIFFGVAAVITVIILANLLGPNASTPVAKSSHSTAAALETGPSPAQMEQFRANLRQTQQQFEQVEAEKQKALEQAQQKPALTAEDLQNAEALREATGERQQYERNAGGNGASQRQQLEAERAQQAYKSLFADNLVRQENVSASSIAQHPLADSAPRTQLPTEAAQATPAHQALNFDPAKQKTYWLPEGTILEAVLTNRLDGEQPGPVNAMLTTNVYLSGTRLLLLPAGARVLGEASQVSAFGQQRLAVAFHRVLVRGLSEYAIPLYKPTPGLAQAGETGLHDKVNNHYASIFGASLAIGAIGGLAQIGNSGSALSYDPSAQFRNGVSQSMAQSSDRVLDKFLNRMPTITIREGTRIKILLTGDLAVPAYQSMN
jgi:type IV secretory pathway VirB10-like protein